MSARTYNLCIRTGAGVTTQASRGQEGLPTRSIKGDCPSNEGVPSLGNPIPNSEAISAVWSYGDVVALKPPMPRRERPVAPYEGSREDPSHGIGLECPGVQSAVENDSQISSSLGSYKPEEEIETPDKIEYPPWTKIQCRHVHSHSTIRSNKKFHTSEQLRAVKIAKKNLTTPQKKMVEWRQDKVWPRRDESTSTRGEGPSNPKGKGINPWELGNINISHKSLDLEAQAAALDSFKPQSSRHAEGNHHRHRKDSWNHKQQCGERPE